MCNFQIENSSLTRGAFCAREPIYPSSVGQLAATGFLCKAYTAWFIWHIALSSCRAELKAGAHSRCHYCAFCPIVGQCLGWVKTQTLPSSFRFRSGFRIRTIVRTITVPSVCTCARALRFLPAVQISGYAGVTCKDLRSCCSAFLNRIKSASIANGHCIHSVSTAEGACNGS